MSRYPQRDVTSRTPGPSVHAASDGLEGAYSAVVHATPSGGTCQVVIPALSLIQPYTALCSAAFTAKVGDNVLVAFDENKQPWVLSPTGLTLDGLPISSTPPSSGQALVFNGSTWVPQFPGVTATTTVARAYRNAALSIPAGGWSKVPIDAVSFDPAGNFDVVTNHRYNVPSSGYYQVNAGINEQLGNNPQITSVAIYKNGTYVAQGSTSEMRGGTAGDGWQSSISDIIQCNAGDYLELWAFNNGGNAAPLNTGPGEDYFSVVQVGTSMNFTSAGGDLSGTYPNPTVSKVNGITVPLTSAAWIAPTLLNSWANVGGTNASLSYLKDPLGFVHIKGAVGGGASGTTVFTLPAGYRPGGDQIFPAPVGVANAYGYIAISATGAVTYTFVGQTQAYFGSTNFLAEN